MTFDRFRMPMLQRFAWLLGWLVAANHALAQDSSLFGTERPAFRPAQAGVATTKSVAEPTPEVRALMQKILAQPVDYGAREQAAPAEVKARLERLRSELRAKGAEFTVTYTTAGDIPLPLLARTVIPRENVAPAVNRRASALSGFDKETAVKVLGVQSAPPACSPRAAEFDWRKLGAVTPVKEQICGTCWAFTAMAAYEGSYAIRNSALIDTSEQYVLNCAKAGSCQGGWWMPVFDFLMNKGTAREQEYRFTGNDTTPCPMKTATPYRVAAWGFVANNQWDIPKVQEIKQALCEHGPLATAVFVDDAFSLYGGGTYDQRGQKFKTVNHGITIIGWSDARKAWLIKNSWGTGWGEAAGDNTKGYMWIAYDTNNIGVATAWVDAASVKYQLGSEWSKALQQFKIKPPPLPKQ